MDVAGICDVWLTRVRAVRWAVWLAALVAGAVAIGTVSVVIGHASSASSGGSSGVATSAGSQSQSRLAHAYGRLPLAFEPNRGQFDRRARFVARGSGYTLFLTEGSAVLSLAGHRPHGQAGRGAAVSIGLPGANPHPVLSGQAALAGRVNYLIGRDRSRWHTNVPTYSRVRYRGVWPGVDLAFYGNQGRLEYDFDLAAGADPNRIALTLQGTRSVRVARGGALVVGLAGGSVRWLAPRAYQLVAGVKRAVASRYVVSGRTVRVRVGRYDHRLPLVIDPTLAYSTYLGGTGADYASGIAVDSSGATYVTGVTESTNFPTVAPYQGSNASVSPATDDAFVTKLAPGGTALVYSTYLGGSDADGGKAIAVDSSGDAYVAGYTASPYPAGTAAFPTTTGAYLTSLRGNEDAFVTKLAPDGASLLYSTYVGGSSGTFGQGNTSGNGIALDSTGAAYVTGDTDNTNFPTTPGAFQTSQAGNNSVFVTKLAPGGGSLAYSTYLGGSDREWGTGIAVDSTGAADITGYTASANFPTQNPYQATRKSTGTFNYDGFVTRLASGGGSLLYSTYLGGTSTQQPRAIAVDSAGAAYVTGQTTSTDFPATTGAYQSSNAGGSDVFVTKLNPADTGSASLIYSTYLGGTYDEYSYGIAVDAAGAAYVTGRTGSYNNPPFTYPYPTTAGAYQAPPTGITGNDAFFTKLAAGGSSLAYSTYLGTTSGNEEGVGIAIDSIGAAYIGGDTNATNFPTTTGAPQRTPGGNYDAFVARFGEPPSAVTDAASAISPTGATLNGSVDPRGASTSYHFDYGTSAGYGSQTADHSAGAGLSGSPVSAAVSGLEPKTTYHFRVVATSAAGTTDGPDRTFTTSASIPVVSTGAASSVGINEATLHGTVNPMNEATTYHFEYGTSIAYGSRVPAASESVGSDYAEHPVSQALSGLVHNTTYHYRVVATNATGTRHGEDKTFTTVPHPLPVNTGAPSIEGDLTEGQTLTEVHGTWTNSPSSYSHQWERCGSATNGCSAIAGATAQTYKLTSTDVGKTIRVQEWATNPGGIAGPANSAHTDVIKAAASPPSKPAISLAPLISGTPRVGQRLSASEGAWEGTPPLTYSYQWQRCKPTCVNIAGATSPFYTPVGADIDARLRVVVTAKNSVGSGQASSKEVGPVAPSVAQIRAWLLKQSVPWGKGAKIAAMLRKSGYAYSLRTLSGGRLVMQWYYLPKGSSLNRPNHKPRPVLVATGTARFAKAAAVKLTVKLTKAGKQRLKNARSLKLTCKGIYTPTANTATTTTKGFTLKR